MKCKIIVLVLIYAVLSPSCSKNVLNEVPESFLSPSNSYQTYAGLQTALTGLYPFLRDQDDIISATGTGNSLFAGTDEFTYAQTPPTSNSLILYDELIPSNGTCLTWWNGLFQLVQLSNAIITSASSPGIDATSAQKNAVIAEARWVRAFVYNRLVNFFDGVPIISQEVTSPVLNFTRSPRDSVLSFIQSDLVFASQNLPDMPPAPGRVSKAAAYQLLAEVDNDLGQYANAVTAASWIINNPKYHLMTQRFGVDASKPGDVFSDLFKDGSQNSPQNTEAIWVMQYQTGLPGFSGSGASGGNDNLRAFGPFYSQLPGFALPPNGADSLGRGVGWERPTPYSLYTIWSGPLETNDMRNSPYNIRRTWYYNQVGNPLYGQQYTGNQDTSYFLYPMYRKVEGIVPNNGTGRTFQDNYKMRLAETYLLRAEAYLGEADLVDAANDINVVRSRANAALIQPSDVTIDFILDERARELMIEEPRRVTLTRLGLLYERVKKYGPIESQNSIQTYNNWFPIPQSVIDANSGAPFPQNPGY